MSGLKLYEATEALLIVDQWLDEHADEIIASGGELPPELAALIDQATAQLEGKVEKVALKVRELLATAGAIALEAKRLSQRAKACENGAEALKAYLKAQLERAGQTKVEGKLATVAIQKNGQPSITVTKPIEDLPKAWRYQPPAPAPILNRDAVLTALKLGEEIPEGIEVVTGTHLRIR
jgi:hypothetical protein